VFWYTSGTGQAVIGPLNASLIHDAPVFLGYVAIVPGMAVFLVRMETEFNRHYQAFYGAVREGGSLERIEAARNGMVEAFRGAVFDIVRMQSVITLIVFVGGTKFLEYLRLSTLHYAILNLQVIAASLQLLFVAAINGLLCLDRRRSVLALTLLLAVLNVALTKFTLARGPLFHGYGSAIALLITVLASLWTLDRKLNSLEYETYMLQ
jgi:uncharacterized membrane protein